MSSILSEPLSARQGMDRIRHIPCIAVQGRLDFVTPVRTAYDLHCAWPEMELRVVPVSVAAVAHEPFWF